MSADSEVTGWYGKLPSLGDFASRRLAPAFVEAWDHWLASGLAAWREQAPDAWLDAYLASPSWRFVLMPGCMPSCMPGESGAWAGVLMPSVDRVGRYFPLTLVRRLPDMPADAAQLDDLLRWLHRLDDLAVDALQDDWAVDRLESELGRLGPWAAAEPASASPARWDAGAAADMLDLDASAGVATLLAGSARHGLLQSLHGKALWLSDDGAGRPAMRITTGLPAGSHFAALLTRSAAATTPTTSFTHEVSHE